MSHENSGFVDSEKAGHGVVASVRSSEPPRYASILSHMSTRSEKGLYVIGSYDSRVTIYSQQIRALNLVYALSHSGVIAKGTSVAIVGGGVSGMTAAVALGSLDCGVSIFERQSDLLHLFRGCHTRFVHPNAYDWPEPWASNDATELPFMNWTAATADQVARKLITQWDDYAGKLPIKVHLSTKVMIRELVSDRRRVTALSPKLDEYFFDVVILCVGFGLEKTIRPQPVRSYWRDSALHQPELESTGKRTHYLISGNGDGGLVDLLRVRLRDFNHKELLYEMEGDDLKHIKSELLKIEIVARNEMLAGNDPSKALYECYRKLSIPEKIERYLARQMRSDTRVTFNYRDWPLSIHSSVLHRLLVSILLQKDDFLHVLPGTLMSVDGHEPDLRVSCQTYSGIVTETFNRVVLRHGPEPIMPLDHSVLHDKIGPELKPRAELDATRRAMWPTDFFQLEESKNDDLFGKATANREPDVLETADKGDAKVPQPDSAEPIPDHVTTNNDETIRRTDQSSGGSRISKEAIFLRDSLEKDMVGGLEAKLAVLSSADRDFLRQSLTERAATDGEAVQGLGQLLGVLGPADVLNGTSMTALVRKAVFSSSVAYKAMVLGLPPAALNLTEPEVLKAFFDDVLETIDNDKFHEVNLLMPQFETAQAAIPEELYGKYVVSLIQQASSSSYQGAPAARGLLMKLPAEIFSVGLKAVGAADLLRQPESVDAILRQLFLRHISAVNEGDSEVAKDYVALSAKEFANKYHRNSGGFE
jgi:hypothetical protein